MHLVEEASADEGHLVHDEQGHVFPLLLQGAAALALQLFGELRIREDIEGRAGCFGTEADVESGDARVSSELHFRLDPGLMELQPEVLQDGAQCGGLPRAGRAAQEAAQQGHPLELLLTAGSFVLLVRLHDLVSPLEDAIRKGSLRRVEVVERVITEHSVPVHGLVWV